MRVNVIGTYNALEAALAHARHASSASSTSRRARSSARTPSTSPRATSSTIGSVGEARWTYAVSKLAGEHMAHAYHDELGLPAVTVHPFNVFGPGQIGGGAIRAFIEAALAGRDLTIHGDGSQIRAWCYVDDMVDGVLACLERPGGGRADASTSATRARRSRSTTSRSGSSGSTGCPGEIVFAPLDYADVELRIPNVDEGARAARLASRRSSSTTASRGRSRGIEGEGTDLIRLARPDVGAEELGAGRGGARERAARRWGRWSRSSRTSSRARARSSTPSRSPPARRRCTSRCSRSSCSRATRCSCPPTRSRRPRTSSRSPACGRCSSTSTRRR